MTITSSTSVVGEQLLERPQPDRVAEDQLGDLLAAAGREHGRGLVDELADGVLEPGGGRAGHGVGPPAVDQPQAQLGGEVAGVVIDGGDTS